MPGDEILARLLTEDLVPLGEGTRLAGNPSSMSLIRWGTYGKKARATGLAVYLDIADIGGGLKTSVQAYRRFLEEVNRRG